MKSSIFLFAVIAVFFVSGSSFVHAQTSGSPSRCVALTTNMRIGSTDVYSRGEVTSLQQFLVGQGYFNSAYLGSGRFGPITYRAVLNFQRAYGLPTTGYVGPMTREVMRNVYCITPTPTVSLYDVQPGTATVGTTVTLTGSALTNNNTILMDGSVVARDVPVSSSVTLPCTDSLTCRGIRQTLLFTVPSAISPYCPPGFACALYMRMVTPGTYTIAVQNENGTSNTVLLTVTDGTSGPALSISGLDAPSFLSLGQTGTWTVRVRTTTVTGNLRYSVVWGDENRFGLSPIIEPQSQAVSAAATFTHSYAQAGTYTPTFTVTDYQGRSVSTSATVTVTPTY